MFRLTAGETWVDGLPAYSEDGALNYGAAAFVYSYIVIVVWILLQVSVAVLLVRACSEGCPQTRRRTTATPCSHPSCQPSSQRPGPAPPPR
jgi:hypothetical protein